MHVVKLISVAHETSYTCTCIMLTLVHAVLVHRGRQYNDKDPCAIDCCAVTTFVSDVEDVQTLCTKVQSLS